MKKFVAFVLVLVFALSLSNLALAAEKIRVGASPSPHAEILNAAKDALLEKYVVAKVSEAELRSLDPAKVAGVRRSAFGAEALVERSAARGLVCDPAGIEDIMLYYLRGERK